jgi:hypothetical protein
MSVHSMSPVCDKKGFRSMKITNVSHVRKLSGLELQAVEMALEDGSIAGDAGLTLTLGVDQSGGKWVPFVALLRDGSKREVVVHFRPQDKTADQRRKEENVDDGNNTASKTSTSKPTAAKKPARRR